MHEMRDTTYSLTQSTARIFEDDAIDRSRRGLTSKSEEDWVVFCCYDVIDTTVTPMRHVCGVRVYNQQAVQIQV